jgi:hypothetical protein
MLRRQNRQAINVRDAFSLSMSSVDAIRDSAGKVANNRLTEVCRASTQTIALLVFMTILGVPCYAQEVTSSQRAQPAQSTIDQTGQDLDQGNANLPAAAGSSQHSKSGQTVATPNNSYVFPTNASDSTVMLRAQLVHSACFARVSQRVSISGGIIPRNGNRAHRVMGSALPRPSVETRFSKQSRTDWIAHWGWILDSKKARAKDFSRV